MNNLQKSDGSGEESYHFYSNWIEAFGPDEDLKELTLVVSTFNRHRHALRTITLFGAFQLKILFLDNSPLGLNLTDQRRLPRNCHYLHHPNQFRWQQMNLDRWINTPYAVLVDDDNIPLLYGMREAVRAMKANPSLGSCASLLAGYCTDSQRLVVPVPMQQEIAANFTRSMSFLGNLENSQKSVKNTSSVGLERLKLQLFETWRGQSWYAVQRTKFLVRNFKAVGLIGELSTSRSSSEVGFEALTAWSAPIGYVNFITQLRALDIDSIEVSGSVRGLSYDEWFHSSIYRDEVREFTRVIVTAMSPLSLQEEDLIFSILGCTARDGSVGAARSFYIFLKKLAKDVLPNRTLQFFRRVADRSHSVSLDEIRFLPNELAPDLSFTSSWLNSEDSRSCWHLSEEYN